MNITQMKKHFLRVACGFALGLTALTCAAAFPDKAVTIVVPYPAGGATDVVARLLAEKLPAVWGQQVVVVNRPGAGTTVAVGGVSSSQFWVGGDGGKGGSGRAWIWRGRHRVHAT